MHSLLNRLQEAEDWMAAAQTTDGSVWRAGAPWSSCMRRRRQGMNPCMTMILLVMLCVCNTCVREACTYQKHIVPISVYVYIYAIRLVRGDGMLGGGRRSILPVEAGKFSFYMV